MPLTNNITKIWSERRKIRVILWNAHTCNVKGFEEVERRWAEIECTLHRSPISSEMSGCSRPFQSLFVGKPTTHGLDAENGATCFRNYRRNHQFQENR